MYLPVSLRRQLRGLVGFRMCGGRFQVLVVQCLILLEIFLIQPFRVPLPLLPLRLPDLPDLPDLLDLPDLPDLPVSLLQYLPARFFQPLVNRPTDFQKLFVLRLPFFLQDFLMLFLTRLP